MYIEKGKKGPMTASLVTTVRGSKKKRSSCKETEEWIR